MGKTRKIFQVRTQEIDVHTGEIIGIKNSTTYINKSSEQFGMYRSTDGLEWTKTMKNQLLFMMVMNEYSNPRTGIVTLSPVLRKEICEFFSLESTRSLSNIISSTIQKDGLTRVNGSNNDFMVNPMCFFKGSTKDLVDRINQYKIYRDGKHNK